MSDTTNINEMLDGRASRYGTFAGYATLVANRLEKEDNEA